jgi:hypothetical protein
VLYLKDGTVKGQNVRGAQQVVNGSAGTVNLEKALEAPLMLQDKEES